MSAHAHSRRFTVLCTGIVCIASYPLVLASYWLATRRPYHLTLVGEPIVRDSPAAIWQWLFGASAFAVAAGLLCILFASTPARGLRFVTAGAALGALIAIALDVADQLADVHPEAVLFFYPTSILFIGIDNYTHPTYGYVVFAFTIVSNALLYAVVALVVWGICRFMFSVHRAATK